MALRAGYQILWINNVHLADDDYLMPVGEDVTRGLVFQGWHAGLNIDGKNACRLAIDRPPFPPADAHCGMLKGMPAAISTTTT